jgi:hypothetical protein
VEFQPIPSMPLLLKNYMCLDALFHYISRPVSPCHLSDEVVKSSGRRRRSGSDVSSHQLKDRTSIHFHNLMKLPRGGELISWFDCAEIESAVASLQVHRVIRGRNRPSVQIVL